jgi:hypothetical protein
LKRSGFNAPSGPGEICRSNSLRTGFVLFPSCCSEATNGTLEDLCLDSLASRDSLNILKDIDGLMENYSFKRMHKNRLHCYLSLTDDYVSLKIGEACNAGAFQIGVPKIQMLKNFLMDISQKD